MRSSISHIWETMITSVNSYALQKFAFVVLEQCFKKRAIVYRNL